MEREEAIVPEAILELLAAAGIARTWRAGMVPMRQGAPGDHIALLLAGRVKVTQSDADGNEILLAIRGRGELLGELALLGGGRRSATVTALERCQVRIIPAERFVALTREHGLEGPLLRRLVRRLQESEAARLELAALPARTRVLRGLVRLAVPAGPGPLEIALDQAELGAAFGLSRASVSEVLSELRTSGIISTQRGRIVIIAPIRLTELAYE